MKNPSRDDFTEKIRKRIAFRAGWLCSFPSCRKLTVGAGSDSESFISIGTASHITAASPGGPRYDKSMSSEERKSVKNGIWMCRDHGTVIDSADPQFTVEKLHEWKAQAEAISLNWVCNNDAPFKQLTHTSSSVQACLFEAARADLDIFRRSLKWPATNINLMLRVAGKHESISTSVLSNLLSAMDDLILIAGPGMGKTTALLQIAEGLLSNHSSTPIFVSLGDWSTEASSIVESILKRTEFKNVSEENFREIASKGRVTLLLDGWNELNAPSRIRARVQLEALKAEFPEIHLVLTTRQQLLDVPIDGEFVELLSLNENQQSQIASSLKGDEGITLVDKALRTSGLNELIKIPLYLVALLKLPKEKVFPTTKEELLRHFVNIHQSDLAKAETLNDTLQGEQTEYLVNLAVFAMKSSNTVIPETNAKRTISETSFFLEQEGQITQKPQPLHVLEALIANHVLIRRPDTTSFMFQHQQFQEWYASHLIEKLILSMAEPASLKTLREDIFDLTNWEEVIFFAVERLSRGSPTEIESCGKAILVALSVDPLLAAEMIYRSTEKVWNQISAEVLNFATKWHVPGKTDRAIRFMLASARYEFLDIVWPLLTHTNDQIRYSLHQKLNQFRPAILGESAIELISGLSADMRKELLSEIAYSSDISGLDLVVSIVKNESNLEIKAAIITTLSFRLASRHILEILDASNPDLLELLVERRILEDYENQEIARRISAIQVQNNSKRLSDFEELNNLLDAPFSADNKSEVFKLISTMSMKDRGGDIHNLLFNSYTKYPEEIINGLLARIKSGNQLFYNAHQIIALSNITLDDPDLLQYSLTGVSALNNECAAVVSLFGSTSVGRLIDEYLEVWKRFKVGSKWNMEFEERFRGLETLIGHTPGMSLLDAISERSNTASIQQIDLFSQLLNRDPRSNSRRPFDKGADEIIQNFILDWARRMLNSTDATRGQKAHLASLASLFPSINLLPILKELLDDNLERYKSLRNKANELNWRPCNIVDEARCPYTHEYFLAFRAIKNPAISHLASQYLFDQFFGGLAARLIVDQWIELNDLPNFTHFSLGVDFRNVKEKYKKRQTNPNYTASEASLIFKAVECLIRDNPTDENIDLASQLGQAGFQLPNSSWNTVKESLLNLTTLRFRPSLLLSMVLSGEVIKASFILHGVSHLIEESRKHSWPLDPDSYQLREWTRLLPFVDNQSEVINILNLLPENLRSPHLMSEMVRAFPFSPVPKSEDTFFDLAKFDTRFISNSDWRATAFNLKTTSSSIRIINNVVAGKMGSSQIENFDLTRELSQLLNIEGVREHLYQLIREQPFNHGISKLAGAIAENPDTEGLLLLIELEMTQQENWANWRTVQRVITESIPIENSTGIYEVRPSSAKGLRKKLLALTTDGSNTDIAAKYLRVVDSIRDEYGTPTTENRHPDLKSGKPWPIVIS